MAKKKNWIKKGIIVFVVLLVIVRMYLPTYLKGVFEDAVNEVEGYECTIKDLDLALYRGAVTMDSFAIHVTDNNVTTPFLTISSTDGSIQWSELFKGRIVSELYLDGFFIHLADDKEDSKKQMGGTDWTEPIRDLINIDINKFEISNGHINFVNKSSKPEINLNIKELNLSATNLSNTDGLDGKLPSDFKMDAFLFESGNLNIEGKINVLQEIPDGDLDLKIEDVNLTELNEVAKEYGNFDFEKGAFASSGEMVLYEGKISGYIKPFFTDVKVLDLQENSTGVLNKVWEGIVGLVLEVTENQKKDQTATKIPLSGSVDNVEVNTLETILNVFKNAFIESFKLEVDDSVGFSDLKEDN